MRNMLAEKNKFAKISNGACSGGNVTCTACDVSGDGTVTPHDLTLCGTQHTFF